MNFRELSFIFAASVSATVAQDSTGLPFPLNPDARPVPNVEARATVFSANCQTGWLGMKLSKPDATIAAQIPSLPVGIGFVVKLIDPGGPAETAKLEPFDVVWKYDDQLLVNEAQLATLLRLSKAGTDVKLAIFRGGQPVEITIKLGEVPARPPGFPRDVTDAAMFPGEGSPMRVVNVAEKTATFANDEGRAILKREGEIYKISIHDSGQKLIYEGEFSPEKGLGDVPKEWQRRVFALRRGLDHALDGRMIPVRPPRPRIVPPTVPVAPTS